MTVSPAGAICVDALALMGEMLKAVEKNVGAKPGKTGSPLEPVLDATPTLADQGIPKKQSMHAQALAKTKTNLAPKESHMSADDALLVIDANKYLDLYRTVSGRKLLAPIDEQRQHIFVTKQIVNEVLRNKLDVAVDFLVQHLQALKPKSCSVPDHLTAAGKPPGEAGREEKVGIAERIKILNESVDALGSAIVERIYRSEDEVSKALAPIFAMAIDHSPEELDRARARREMGNPPGKSNNPVGDQLTWEQILSKFPGKKRLWLISRDDDYSTKFGRKRFLNPFLLTELRAITSSAEAFVFDDVADGIRDFADKTGAKAAKLPTPQEAEQIKKEEEQLPRVAHFALSPGGDAFAAALNEYFLRETRSHGGSDRLSSRPTSRHHSPGPAPRFASARAPCRTRQLIPSRSYRLFGTVPIHLARSPPMPFILRVQRTEYIDKNKKRVPRGAPGARKVTTKSRTWYGCGIPGQPPKKRVPLASDREAAERMLAKLVREAEQGSVNVPNKKAANTPLADYLKDFKRAVTLGLASRSGRPRRMPDERQVNLVVQRLRDVCEGCGFEYPADFNPDAPERLALHLHARMGKPRNKIDRGISAQTANFMVAAARRFTRWLHEKVSTVRADLFDRIPAFDAANGRVHARRDVAPDELARLLEAARASERVIRCLSGVDRHHLYLVAFATGFRASELAVLTPAHFHLEADPPAVALPGKATKNKKAARLPLVPGVAVALRSYLKGKPAAHPVWPGKWHIHAAKMLREDLAAAEVPYVVDGPDGKQFADFHALRHTFCSTLAASGAGVKELQTLARHGDSRTTLNLYTHARSAELVRTINRLRVPGTVHANPLAELDRDQLEGLVIGLAVILGGILAPPAGEALSGLRAPPRAPVMGTSGNFREPLDTTRQARAGAD